MEGKIAKPILLKIYPFRSSTDGNMLKSVLPGLLLVAILEARDAFYYAVVRNAHWASRYRCSVFSTHRPTQNLKNVSQKLGP